MQLDRYALKADRSLMVFEFFSEGPRGKICKLVQFGETNLKGLYNLGFGDKDPSTGELDDSIVSDNRDREKVLSTVVACVYAFTEHYQHAWVYATGSSPARTRLYRMGISKYLVDIQQDFEIYGQIDGDWETFCKGRDYAAFLVLRKND